MHNLNRSQSFDRIDVDFFVRNWPDQPVKMTVSDITIGHLAEGVTHLHELGIQIQCNLAQGVDWSEPEHLGTLAAELDKLISFYTENPAVAPCDLLTMHLASVGGICREGRELSGIGEHESRKWCGIGTDLVAVDVDGREYPCHLFLPFAAGDRSETFRNADFADCRSLLDPRCRECILLPVCPTCYGMSLLRRGNAAERDEPLCTLTNLRALACSNMQARMLADRDRYPQFRDSSEEVILFTIMGIEAVQSGIRIPPASESMSRVCPVA